MKSLIEPISEFAQTKKLKSEKYFMMYTKKKLVTSGIYVQIIHKYTCSKNTGKRFNKKKKNIKNFF